MESDTFVSMFVDLIHKSRRALRLYSHAGGHGLSHVEGLTPELSSNQVAEWRDVNGMLLKKLSESAESPSTKKLVYDVFSLRNEFQTLWRTSESELTQQQGELIAASERGDFIKASSLAVSLVSLKARVQAGQAAHHELDVLIRRSRVVRPAAALSDENKTVLSTIELLDEQSVDGASAAPEKMKAAGGGKVIPLKPR
jgi:hypothetical protein